MYRCYLISTVQLAMWNVTGLQGAVLTHFMEPVYFDTVIIGGCFSLYHITRALVNRYKLLTIYELYLYSI